VKKSLVIVPCATGYLMLPIEIPLATPLEVSKAIACRALGSNFQPDGVIAAVEKYFKEEAPNES
jgi:hypothetical protein